MKKILFLLIITTLCFTSKAIEVRAMMVEPYPPIITHRDSMMHYQGDVSLGGIGFYGPKCFMFYDTLLRYDCPCLPDDTVTEVHWTFFFGPFPYRLDTTVPKGTVYYRCYEATQAQWQFTTFGGTYETKYPTSLIQLFIGKPYAIFGLQELESSCNHKKWQLIDSSQNIPLNTSAENPTWYLIIKDSLQNIVQIDSGKAIAPYSDSVGMLITHQRQSPTFEINTPGIYSVSYIITRVDWAPRHGLTDTSTTYVRVPDCATGIKNNTQNTNIHVQILQDNFIQITNNNQTYKQQFLRLYSIDGKLLFEQPLNNKQYNLIKFNKFGIGMFILTIIEENKIIYSNKIVLK